MADIKINADVSAVKKSLQEITQSAKQLGKSPIDLLSPQTVKMLQGEANAQLGELNNKAKTLRSEIEAQARAVDKAARGTRQYASEMKKLVSLTREVAQNQSQIGGMKSAMGGAGMGGGGGGRRGGMMGRMGGMMKGLGGLAGGALLGAGGALLGYGASKVMGGIGSYKAGMGERIQMRGMGMDPTMRQSGRASALGMDQSSLRQARMAGSKAFGAAGGGESATLRRGEYERSFGLDSGTMAGMGGAMRQQVGGKAAAADIEKSLASAVSAGLHDADIGAYLETAVGLLGSIDSSGIKDRAQMLGALADVTRATKDSPEQIARGLGGIDSAISGSTGERNAFFQQALGGKGKSIGEAQFAVEGGLTGLDLGRVAGLSGQQRKQLGGIGGGTQKRAQSILKQFSSQGIDVERLRSGKASKQEQIVAGRFAKQIFGTKTSAEGLGQLGLLSQVAKGGPGGQSAQKKLENARRTIEEKSDAKLGKIANSNEAMLQKLEAIRKINEENIGAQASAYYAKALEFLNMIDKTMMSLFRVLGGETEADKLKKDKHKEVQQSQHAARIAKGEIAREKSERTGGKISKLELQSINTADRLKKKHSGIFGGLNPGMESAIQEERGKISKKKIRKEAAPIEGSPLKSTAKKAESEASEVPESAADMLKQINDKLGVANKQRNENVPLMLQGIRGKKSTNTFGF